MPAREWEKVLWKDQHYPDNYIPPNSFLSALRTNPNFRPYTYWPVVLLSCPVSQHLATIFIFLAIFVRLKEQSLDPRILVWGSVVCFVLGYVVWELLDTSDNSIERQHNRIKTFKSSILMFLALLSLSPVLRTLTAATSSDSIWALSAFLFILNILLTNYGSTNTGRRARERLTSVLSLNAAISSSVVLASRLTDDLAVFALILFSVQLFALFPMLRHRVQGSSAALQASLSVILSVLSIALTIPISATVTYIYSATLISVPLLAPAILVWAQKYKNEIRGPWDVAVPKITFRINRN